MMKCWLRSAKCAKQSKISNRKKLCSFIRSVLKLKIKSVKRFRLKLVRFYTDIAKAWQAVAELDFVLARARLAVELELIEPQISTEESHFAGLFYPQVKALLEQQKRRFSALGYPAVQCALHHHPVPIWPAKLCY